MTNVEIDNFQCRYYVPKGETSPHKIKQRLDNIARNMLDKESDRILSHTLSDDSSILFIKDLKINFSLNIARQDNRVIAELWAKKIASAVKSTLISSGQKNNMVKFANKSDYLASFIVDLLRGVARKKWYYQEFEQLKKFDTRGLIKELLSQSSEIAEDILLLITEKNSLDNLLRELREEDIKIIYEDYIDNRKKQERRDFKELIGILTKKLDESSLVLPGEKFSSLKNYLSLYLRTIQRYPELKSVINTKKAVKLTFLLKEFYRKYEGEKVLLTLIEPGDMDGFLRFVQSKRDRELSELPVLFKEVINSEGKEAFFEIVRGVKEKTESISAEKIITPYGGLFIFIRAILEYKLPLVIHTSSFPEPENLPGIQAFLFFLAQRVAGWKEFQYEGLDPGLLLFAGFESAPVPYLLKQYKQTVTPEMNGNFIKTLSKLLPPNLKALVSNLPENAEDIDFETILNITTELLYTAFASRLRRFENSNPEYLFKNFLYRQSEITLDTDHIHVKLSRKPLDVVLRLSGLLEDINRIPWFGNRSIKFMLERY